MPTQQVNFEQQITADGNLLNVSSAFNSIGIGGAAVNGTKLKVYGDLNVTGVVYQGNNSLESLYTSITGWIPISLTWTRTGNHTFTVSSDVTATYRKGAKVRYKDGGSYEYGVIASSSYSNPTTTVTLITNTDYAMAAATITEPYLSYIENPEGFPQWFNYTSTLGGFSGTPSVAARFSVSGKSISMLLDISGTSNATTFTATAPVANGYASSLFIGGFRAADNGTVITATVPAFVLSASSTAITFYKDWGATAWTAAGTKSAQISLTYEF